MDYSVDIRTCRTAAEVLQTISTATERESLPFVSTSTRMQTDKSFVASVSGNKFRIWRVPSARGHGTHNRYLRGEVRDNQTERQIVGSFAVHPTNVVRAFIPFVMAALAWWLGIRSIGVWIFIAACFAMGLIMIVTVIGPRPAEEAEVSEFLRGLFGGGHRREAGMHP